VRGRLPHSAGINMTKDATKAETSPKATMTRSDSMNSLHSDERDNIYLAAPNSIRLKMINWGGSAMLFAQSVFELRLVPPAIEAMIEQARSSVVDDTKVAQAQAHLLGLYLTMGWKWALLVVVFMAYCFMSRRAVYLLDFAVYQPPKEWQVSHQDIIRLMRKLGPDFTEESLEFTERLLARSATSQCTHWPPGLINNEPTLENARKESEIILTAVVEDVLKKTGLAPKDIDILIVNCSIFCPTPSMCAMIANKFKMRHDIESYNLSGMGCSAGVISIHLAKQLLQAKPNSTALVISTENITQNMYLGNERRFLLQNTLFRCGGAAIVLSNKWMDGLMRAKYKLLHTIRHQDCSEDSYKCVYEEEDELGNSGVSLSKQITQIAGRALKNNLTKLGPLILPFREMSKVVVTTLMRSMVKAIQKQGFLKSWEINVHVPDFKKAVEHFCIHAGGRAVIDGIKENLKLTDKQVEPSVSTLYNYGNTSSSSIWYELAFVENQKDTGKMRRGDRVLQLAFGSGFKCNSAVWVRLS